ncbi:PLP-dependent aminotransferase family protein [Maribius pontilimi]|uniref:PLP-dependent aminotransferase family protein n=1 Tax=Palleronia pontilimi TaxID=1964209 RepID=A0A934IGC5_9RHOB|nr:PLP-dependent aminotransferase family protein [Palleronia pontilimi]MBJ3762388.1 PLP-dependent aminotransferase family protein [Palleronia pontilimi]
MGIAIDTFFLNPHHEGTLQTRIQRMVAQGILSGRFRPGEKLPSSRALAAHLGVSRMTVTLAYTELVADAYLTARGRSGYYVGDDVPQPSGHVQVARADSVDWDAALRPPPPQVPRVERPRDWRSYRYPFIYGQTDPTLFDHSNWRLCAVQALGARDFEAMTADLYDRDDPKLVDFIARQSLPRRGILAAPDEILVTMGAQNALWLAAQVLLGPGGRAVIEDPSYPPLRDILRLGGASILPVGVDASGLRVDGLPKAGVVFTTPSHHCPTSATMPLERRRALLALAAERDMLVVEDDYEFEMSFLGPPAPALKSLDRDGRVIHVGSFSKSLFPGLRLGYLVGSKPFIAAARALRSTTFRHPPGHIQRTAAHFLELGHYHALLNRMSRAYRKRRAVMEAAIAAHGLEVAGRGSFGGSSLWMRAPGIDTHDLAARLRARSVLIEPGSPFFADPARGRDTYRLAYSSIPEDRIADGIALIAEEVRRMPGRPAS